jgi:hypothetical protein
MQHHTTWIGPFDASRVRRDESRVRLRIGTWLAMATGLVVSTAAFADTLPLETGKYVLSSVPCVKALPSTSYYYDGLALARGRARFCHARVTGNSGTASVVRTTCKAGPERVESIIFNSTHNFTQVGRADSRSRSYRLCERDPLTFGSDGRR